MERRHRLIYQQGIEGQIQKEPLQGQSGLRRGAGQGSESLQPKHRGKNHEEGEKSGTKTMTGFHGEVNGD